MLQHYTFFRSSAAYRVRIALNLKGLEAEEHYIHLRKGEQRGASYLALNPQGLLPALIDDGAVLGQSLAIIEYLEETRPEPPLLPADPVGRARVRQLALAVACDIHPLDNLKVLNYLGDQLGADDDGKANWFRHWINEGFGAIETLLANSAATGEFCHGDAPGLADICLVPQLFNARRFDTDLSAYPTILRVEAACQALDAFARAAPGLQPDAE
jgi:maleylacetoacetate isomerase